MKTAIKEKPILFRAAMVRAILDGRKRQTRRLVKPQPIESPCNPPVAGEKGAFYVCPDWFPTAEQQGSVLVHCEEVGTYHCMGKKQFIDNHCPYGQPGDRLWVKETWQAYDGGSFKTPFGNARTFSNNPKLGDLIEFKADKDLTKCFISWRSPIHMPRWASRITLEVTEVRVERLQQCTEDDAQAEGFERPILQEGPYLGTVLGRPQYGHPLTGNYLDALKASWNSHNAAPFDWASNPYVWVVSFRRVEQGVRA